METQTDEIVSTEQGSLRGQYNTGINGTSFLSFSGIPYAKAPVGNLRFRAPQPPEKWTGVRDATKEGNSCFTLKCGAYLETMTESTESSSEDCLFLNIYTRNVYEKKPVMVFIHGGSFIIGSSSRTIYGPEYLMTENIVLVMVNYRLGVLGFLGVADPCLDVCENAGLKDQVEALKWIQKNIDKFGGDPNNVTIIGESAGAACVHFLLLSPLTKGLFHRAILQSGSALCPWARGKSSFKQLAEICGFKNSDSQKIIDYLRELPVEELIDAQTKLEEPTAPEEQRYFAPIVEAKTEGALVADDPLKIIQSGVYNHVPLILGYNAQEGMLTAVLVSLGINVKLGNFISFSSGLKPESEEYKRLNQKVCQFYFNSDAMDMNKKEGLYNALTDLTFLRPIWKSCIGHSSTSKEPIYLYKMTLDTCLNTFKSILQTKEKGTMHGDEMGYLFKMRDHPTLTPDSLEMSAVIRFVKMWKNFASNGVPIPQKDELLNAEWKPLTETEFNYLEIGQELMSGTNPDIERMQFWDEMCKEL